MVANQEAAAGSMPISGAIRKKGRRLPEEESVSDETEYPLTNQERHMLGMRKVIW